MVIAKKVNDDFLDSGDSEFIAHQATRVHVTPMWKLHSGNTHKLQN